MRSNRTLALALLLTLPLLGCGKSGPKLAAVSGRVMLDKKPLANADIVFSPSAKDSSQLEASGRTDGQGHYSLQMIEDRRDGATIGDHKVRISLIERGASLTNRLPKVYNQNTTLTFIVPAGGTTEANFNLTSDGRGK